MYVRKYREYHALNNVYPVDKLRKHTKIIMIP